MSWIIVHDGNRTVCRARRKARDQNGTVPVALAMQAGYIESYSIVLVVGQSHWTRECQCPSASGTEQLGRSAKVMANVGHFSGRS